MCSVAHLEEELKNENMEQEDLKRIIANQQAKLRALEAEVWRALRIHTPIWY